MSRLEELTLTELKELAKKNNIKNISKLKKEELITVLNHVIGDTTDESHYIQTNIENEIDESEKREPIEKQYDENGEPIVDYKLTNEGDEIVEGILDILPDGYGFLRGENYLPSPKDVYISPVQIKRFRLDKGDKIKGISRQPKEGEKFPALIFVGEVNRTSSRNGL